MNPNMRYHQIVPDHREQRGNGVISASASTPTLLDAIALLDMHAPGWTGGDHACMRQWLAQFLDWMRTSDLGRQESDKQNNHGTYKDLQDAALAVHLGQRELAEQIVRDARRTRIDLQIAADGSQPHELSRTRPWHYSAFNLMALCQLADVARCVDVDLWSYEGAGGGSLVKAIEYLIAAATSGRVAWSAPEPIDEFDRTLALPLLHAAADAGRVGLVLDAGVDSRRGLALPAVARPMTSLQHRPEVPTLPGWAMLH